MADLVSTVTILNAPHKLTIKLLNLSDATGESGVTKVTASSYTGVGNPAPTITSFRIERIEYDCKAMSVAVYAAGTTPIKLAELTGFGVLDYSQSGGISTANTGTGAGNITFTTSGQAANSSYDITFFLRKIGG